MQWKVLLNEPLRVKWKQRQSKIYVPMLRQQFYKTFYIVPFVIMNQVQLMEWGLSNLCDFDTADTLQILNACNQLSLFDFYLKPYGLKV